jgi:hypothetical protein
MYAQVAVGVSLLAFGGFSWALDGASAPVAAVLKLESAMAAAGALSSPALPRATPRGATTPVREIRFRDVTFAYPSGQPILEHFDLTIPAGSSLAIVGQNGAGKTTLAKLLCRLYDPQSGAIEVDGVDLREIDVASWRARVTAVFQDFIRLELPLRDNVAPSGAPDEVVRAALESAGAANLAGLDTILARGYTGGTISRVDNGSVLRWRERWPPSGSAPASSCSTSRPRSSTCAASPRSSSGSLPRPGSARRSSFRIASRPSARRIASACSSTAASSSSARTTS